MHSIQISYYKQKQPNNCHTVLLHDHNINSKFITAKYNHKESGLILNKKKKRGEGEGVKKKTSEIPSGGRPESLVVVACYWTVDLRHHETIIVHLFPSYIELLFRFLFLDPKVYIHRTIDISL